MPPSTTRSVYLGLLGHPNFVSHHSPPPYLPDLLHILSRITIASLLPSVSVDPHQQNVKTSPGPPRGVIVPLVLLVHRDPPWSTFSVKFQKVWIRMDQSGPCGPQGPQPPLVDQERSGPPWTTLRHFPDAYRHFETPYYFYWLSTNLTPHSYLNIIVNQLQYYWVWLNPGLLVGLAGYVLLTTCRILNKLRVSLFQTHPKFPPQCLQIVWISHCSLYTGVTLLSNSFLQLLCDPPEIWVWNPLLLAQVSSWRLNSPVTYSIHPLSISVDFLCGPWLVMGGLPGELEYVKWTSSLKTSVCQQRSAWLTIVVVRHRNWAFIFSRNSGSILPLLFLPL